MGTPKLDSDMEDLEPMEGEVNGEFTDSNSDSGEGDVRKSAIPSKDAVYDRDAINDKLREISWPENLDGGKPFAKSNKQRPGVSPGDRSGGKGRMESWKGAGWCKQRSDLLLVYDYIPNGSLDFFLYGGGGQRCLSWEQRFRVLKGIAAGLLYLHEEWEQVVIHRDVKSSNVLIDGEMNGRLGDFGLARLYNHRTAASHTTNVVGTVGYIAPESARTGKASTRSDVFAFGVLLLETASGRGRLATATATLYWWTG
ncbi:unnamed protein product [Linum tenue]|uniref:Protein kinase domain-containing protein n=2 Tax=Linum tenue TaxID=586396 RepID=A0AAV0QSL9_9ROSI|nr:unnamed protein product [Linum tenue]